MAWSYGTLRDSQGQKELNQIYLQAMQWYLRDKYQDIHEETKEDWATSWHLNEDSLNSLCQSNGHDCGLFVLANTTYW